MILAILNLIASLVIIVCAASFFVTGYEFQRMVDGKYFSPEDKIKIKELAHHKLNMYSMRVIILLIFSSFLSIWWVFNGYIFFGVSLWIMIFAKWYELDWAKRVRNLKNK